MSSTEPVNKYDSNGKLIYYKDNRGIEVWWKYDSNGNCIHSHASDGVEWWREYDSNGNEIRYRDSYGNEEWYWEGEEIKDPVKILLLATQLYSKAS
jgi:YD repeat-containing protein